MSDLSIDYRFRNSHIYYIRMGNGNSDRLISEKIFCPTSSLTFPTDIGTSDIDITNFLGQK